MPSPLLSSLQFPPQTPIASNVFPKQSHSPFGIPSPSQIPHSSKYRHEPSSTVAFESKLQAISSVHPSPGSHDKLKKPLVK